MEFGGVLVRSDDDAGAGRRRESQWGGGEGSGARLDEKGGRWDALGVSLRSERSERSAAR